MNISFIGCRNTTKEAISRLLENKIKINNLITLDKKNLNKYHISGFEDLSKFCKTNRIKIHYVEKYNLKSDRDYNLIRKLNIDILFVLGWQRIIPEKILNLLKIGAFGMHGTPLKPPHGRGHSVMNWSLIEGRKKFTSYLFKLDKNVDSGTIVGLKEFDINYWDTCETLHFKYMLTMVRLILLNINRIKKKNSRYQQQDSDNITYYKKRRPDDSLINWQDTTINIYNFIRAVTKPYPAAFTYLKKVKLTLFKSQPFDTFLTWPKSKPGEILEIFDNSFFLVKTLDSSLLVTEYDGFIGKKHKGMKLK